MEAIAERCCGLDVHKSRVVACILSGSAHQKPSVELRTFSTFTRDLVEMAKWIKAAGCTHVAMESTGVYWKPVFTVLEAEGGLDVIVGNAHHMKNVPGRKTDVKDAQWIAELLRMGLIKRSFIPSPELRELRELTRYRKTLVEVRTAECNRITKLLETANVKLGSVATDVFGVSGVEMMHALVENKSSPEEMAELARGKLRKKLPELKLALDGRVTANQRQLLRLQLRRLKEQDRDIDRVDKMIARRMKEHEHEIELLSALPGIQRTSASAIIAEVGPTPNAFSTIKAFVAWIGLCPGNNESAGKHRAAGMRKGNKHLRTMLIECAWAAVRTKNSYWRDKYYRLKTRRGEQRAIVAIAHKLARVIYVVLTEKKQYQELGSGYLDQIDKEKTRQHLVRRLQMLGLDVETRPHAA